MVLCLKITSPNIARGIVMLNPTVTVKGLVSNIAFAQQKSLTNVMRQLTKIITTTLGSLGRENGSQPKKSNTISDGHRKSKLKRPTKPKKSSC